MGIKEMLLREDFYKILRETIVNYAQSVHQTEIRCEYEPFEDSEPWLINTILGFVSRTPTHDGVRTYMKSEYNIRGSFIKNVIGKAAVDIIATFPNIGSNKKIYISKGAFAPSMFIVPQNRSIRFYDYERGTVDCMVKAGFTSKYFDNQAQFRKKYQYDFLNPMSLSGDGWFQERILFGHPLIRTTNEILFRKGTENALKYLTIIAKDSIEWFSAKEYISDLTKVAFKKIQIAEKKKDIKRAETAKHLIKKACDYTRNLDKKIPTCMSHGDFQAGNIWIEPNGKTLIYDWETAGRRSIWYDSATLSYSLRRTFGWPMLLKDKKMDKLELCMPKGMDVQICKSEIVGILLLEDMLFYLDDMLELPKDWGYEIFDRFIENIKEVF